MQVQKIQSTNNYQNQTFKAKFVNDSNGYLRRVWKSAVKNEDLTRRIDELVNKYPNHELEIAAFEDRISFCQYDIFNRTTGKTDCIVVNRNLNDPNTMQHLLYYIMNGNIFREDNETKLYQKLTGNKKG